MSGGRWGWEVGRLPGIDGWVNISIVEDFSVNTTPS
jgi:hypothetical protein